MPAIEFNHVWKKFRKGGGHTSLRDAISSGFSRLLSRQPKTKNNQLSTGDSSFWALKDISFTVEKGEALGIIGSNGAGKTTILKLLSGILRSSKGEIRMNGRVSSLIELGAGFHPDLTGRENVYLNASILGMKREEIKREFDSIVEFSGVEEFIDMPVKRYSSGMYVRLGFAVASHVDSDVLLIDEVLAVGDLGFQNRCLEKMAAFREEGRSIVFVSHNLGHIESLCDQAVCLRHGELESEGTPGEVIARYLGSFEKTSTQASTPAEKGGADIEIEQVVLAGSNGTETNEFDVGDGLLIRIHYNARKRVEHPCFSLGINAVYGYSLIGASMSIDGNVPEYVEGKGVVECRFESMPLMPREYKIFLGVTKLKTMSSPIWWDHIATFRIKHSSIDRLNLSGKAIHSGARYIAPIHVSHEWRFEDGRR